MRSHDVWIMTLIIIIIVSCIKLEKPQMIDCSIPAVTPKDTQINTTKIESIPTKIEVNHFKQSLESCEEEIKRLKWESDLFMQQRDDYLEQLRKCSDHHYQEMPLDEETV